MLLALAEGVQVAIVGALGMVFTAGIGAYVTIVTSRARNVGVATNAVLDKATDVAIDQQAELAALRAEVATLREGLERPATIPPAGEGGAAS